MNEEELGRLSRKLAQASVPDAVQARLRAARARALAPSTLQAQHHVAVLRHPIALVSTLALLLALSFSSWNSAKTDAIGDIALLASDVPFEALLDTALLEDAHRLKATP